MINKALLNRRLRQIHLWMGAIIGIQVGIWLVSGLFMTWFHIETVRGNHLRAEAGEPPVLSFEDILHPGEIAHESQLEVRSTLLKSLDNAPVWLITHKSGRSLVDARSGEVISPISEELAIGLASAAFSGENPASSAQLYETPPREYGGKGPVWGIEFDDPKASFYVDAITGDVRAVRTGLWRAFDFMWGLHIMDWKERENFNSWWIKLTAVCAVVFFLTGVGLVTLRVNSSMQRSKAKTS
jgi:uncharacterized iron-regulated membrane protein